MKAERERQWAWVPAGQSNENTSVQQEGALSHGESGPPGYRDLQTRPPSNQSQQDLPGRSGFWGSTQMPISEDT